MVNAQPECEWAEGALARRAVAVLDAGHRRVGQRAGALGDLGPCPAAMLAQALHCIAEVGGVAVAGDR